MLLAAIDLSTKQLDACFIPLDPDVITAPIYRRAVIAKLDGSAERVRDAGRAAAELFVGLECATCVIERPAGRGWYSLLPVFGAVIARIPTHVPSVAWMASSEWRRELGVGRHKLDAAQGVRYLAKRLGINTHALDEHQLDALGLALAWRQHLHQRAAA